MAWKYSIALLALAVISAVQGWENLPNLPSGKRTQYYVIVDNEGYKYGYDTGEGHFAKQSGDAHNQVDGHFFYKDASGKDVDVRYTAGVQGYVPEGIEKLLPQPGEYMPAPNAQGYSYPAPSPQEYSHPAPVSYSSGTSDDEANTGDASYSFAIDTDTYKRQESSDAGGNVKGHYSYSNAAGHHDLSYIAGSNTGFVATSGSLSSPNGVAGSSLPSAADYSRSQGSHSGPQGQLKVNAPGPDGSYSFEYTASDHSRQESSDASGNVRGRYSYQNTAGSHDLSYVAGSQTGFQVTGGSLANPNGVSGQHTPSAYSAPATYHGAGQSHQPTANTYNANQDGSYSFEYSTSDQSRQESSDAHGNVQGRFSYKNKAGTHDLSYVAGSETGFQPTGGSLANPNGVPAGAGAGAATGYQASGSDGGYDSQDDQANTGDASYSFTIDTDEYKRVEASDAQGNVKGHYSYTNKAGNHDLSYVAGSATGFVATGGSLSVPQAGDNTYPTSHPTAPETRTYQDVTSVSSTDDEANTGDASYEFNIDTDEYKRHEQSDAQGNVKGSYSYRNSAGSHDLSYVAGEETGFQVTGGSLAQPNGLEGKTIPAQPSAGSLRYQQGDASSFKSNQGASSAGEQTGDASYNFSFDTDDYKRQESSDAQGNVQGRYSYKNLAGSHDLSYVAGSETGFQVTGGSLAEPNGLVGKSVPLQHSPSVGAPSAYSSGSTEDETSSGDASYSFTIDTPDYKRMESSDAQGNVRGRYSYTNVFGSHDLSYKAGTQTGFVATGGSLSSPNGAGKSSTVSAASRQYLPPQIVSKSRSSPTAHLNLPTRVDKVDNLIVKTYYPAQVKHGYSFESA